ncbi:MAG: hypothetical protein KC506_00425 [Nanoarchaeota archaeon]|nr:hypothetical protein [Nanoarchaeota archaeon]
MEKRNNLIYLLVGIFLLLILSSIYFSFNKPLLTKEFDVKFIVDESSPGFDVNTSLLIFGKTSPGGSEIVRFLNISNSYDFPVRLDVSVSKEISRAIYTNSSLTINSGKNLELPVRLKVPEDFSLGNYSGKLKIEMYRAD